MFNKPKRSVADSSKSIDDLVNKIGDLARKVLEFEYGSKYPINAIKDVSFKKTGRERTGDLTLYLTVINPEKGKRNVSIDLRDVYQQALITLIEDLPEKPSEKEKEFSKALIKQIEEVYDVFGIKANPGFFDRIFDYKAEIKKTVAAATLAAALFAGYAGLKYEAEDYVLRETGHKIEQLADEFKEVAKNEYNGDIVIGYADGHPIVKHDYGGKLDEIIKKRDEILAPYGAKSGPWTVSKVGRRVSIDDSIEAPIEYGVKELNEDLKEAKPIIKRAYERIKHIFTH